MTSNFFQPSLLLLFLDPGSGMGKNQDPGSKRNGSKKNTKDKFSTFRLK